MLRTHTCGDLRKDHVGESTTLCGWVQNYRDHGGLVFIDLRDRYGLTQVVFNPDFDPEMHAVARDLRAEDVIQVTGEVIARGVDGKGKSLENPKLPTGQIEVRARELSVLNKSKTPPFEPNSQNLPNEELRLKYRFIDLRRKPLQDAMVMKHRLMQITRNYFDIKGFLEIETPILGKSTPEGARDYLVPSRIHEGAFYALPQSPQIYKQILMVAGYDRYYQIARCFRDEDLRADRQPEFTQVDIEMAFVEREDVLTTIDGLIAAYYEAFKGKELPTPLPRFSHAEVMERFGTDKPDMRFGMELVDVKEIAAECGFGVFKGTIDNGGRVRGINAKGAAGKYSRKDIDGLTEFVKGYGAKGLAFFRVKEEEGKLQLDSPIAKFFEPEHQAAIIEKLGGEAGDLLFFVADKAPVTSAALAALRNRLGKELELYGPDDFDCHWVLDFPLVVWDEEENRWEAEHHPFCMVHPDDADLMATDPGKVRAASYDLVCNGYEAASGSVRIHDPKVQQQVFDLIGMSAEEAEKRFDFLLEALRYGAPPHAGIALGLDRWVMMFGDIPNIRDVIAFPKTQKASDLMSGAPGEVDTKQLKELHIKVDASK
ncbi:aspartate--tRNA ligase [Stratiformator vulcanicus]|uniref:Aspartate--tRNA(Asp/Asn) ligase n=1 Tax=Stratiformator vulcanicus TaxID=2527980 RepID=A0A517QVM9_9PLAN|nr:aspartate--tRNA ligase [Stratiformator vulcanicus]QDT35712.1 Aspartate--tRNA ligase [Stratiformator vulcanicus]